MGSANPQHEPTMEEILASIRKIISEDSAETATPKQEPEVLDLTDEVAGIPVSDLSATETHASPAPAPYVPPAAPPAPEPAPENEVVFMPKEQPAEGNPARPQQLEHEGIFSEKARKAIDHAFSKIEMPREEELGPVPAPATAPARTSAGAEDHSVEAVFERAVRGAVDPTLREWMDTHRGDLLTAVKPLIREWMDEHFPAILEGAIREEVARVVKARGGR